jgi:hypothetical protein
LVVFQWLMVEYLNVEQQRTEATLEEVILRYMKERSNEGEVELNHFNIPTSISDSLLTPKNP